MKNNLVVSIIDDFLDSNDVVLVQYKSKKSKKNMWVVNGEKKYRNEVKKMIQDFAIKNEYGKPIDIMMYDNGQELLYQFCDQTYNNRPEYSLKLL